MRTVQTFSPVAVAHMVLAEKLKTAEIIVDATCGNGWDCLFLAQNSLAIAKIHAFDIQKESILKTQQLLAKNQLSDKVVYYQDNFVNIKKYLAKKIDITIFNLGYLPGGDKQITTSVEDLLKILPEIMEILAEQGVIVLVSYLGHEQGKKEFAWLEKYLPELSNKVYNVGKYQLFNHQKPSPIVYIIEKV